MAATPSSGPVQLMVKQKVTGTLPTIIWPGRQKQWKPAGAWMPDQVVDMLVEGMCAGDFYILCPDNEVTREVDNRRITWAAEDITQNRPALSRWHPDYKEPFERFLKAVTPS